MRNILRICVVFCACMCAVMSQAQNYTVKSVNLLASDLTARKNLRNDSNGVPCAVIKLNIVGVKDLQFPDAVGEVQYSLGEYIIYVPENLATFTFYNNDKSISQQIKFDDWGYETIERQQVFRIVLDSDNKLRTAIFSIYPQNAKLKFNGKNIELDNAGVAIIEERIGEYSYEVSAEGYESVSGQLALTDEDVSTMSNIVLQEKKYSLELNSNVSGPAVYIDNVSMGNLTSTKSEYHLTEGKHVVRLVAPKYKDFETQINITGNTKLPVKMDEMHQKVIKYRKERSRTRTSVRDAFYFNVGAEGDESFNIDNDYSYRDKFKVQLAYSTHFAGIFELSTGIGAGYMDLDYEIEDEVDPNNYDKGVFFDLPLQVGLGLPYGRYNQHKLSVLAGGYGRCYCLVAETNNENATNNDESEVTDVSYYGDYGLRASVRLDFNALSLGCDYSISLHDSNRSFIGVNLGWKINY